MRHATFATPDLTMFCRLDELGLVAVGQRLEPDRAVIECRVAEPDPWCWGCGSEVASRGTVTRHLAHEPFGHRPTTLLVRVRRYRCPGCGRGWREDTRLASEPRAKLSRGGLRWALAGLVVDHLSISRVAAGLGVAWHTANTAVLEEGRRVLIDDPTRFDGVAVIGVDEHVWRHTGLGDGYVTVIIDLTPARDGVGPSRLLDMIPGRSGPAFQAWLTARPQSWRDGVEVVAMDGFTGYKTAAAEAIPDAVAVMDPFHVVQLAGQALDTCRQRVQQRTMGHRGRKGDPLFQARRVLRCSRQFLTEKQAAHLETVFAIDEHVEVETTWAIYQEVIAAYRHPRPQEGKCILSEVIDRLRSGVPVILAEAGKLGRTLNKRAADVLAYFDHPGTSNGPTEAINGRLEHLRGSALGFRNLHNYIARSLLETGGFRPLLPPQMR